MAGGTNVPSRMISAASLGRRCRSKTKRLLVGKSKTGPGLPRSRTKPPVCLDNADVFIDGVTEVQRCRLFSGSSRAAFTFTCGRRRGWRLCLATQLAMLLAANFALRLVLRLAAAVTRRVTMRLLMQLAMRLAEGRDLLLTKWN